MSLERKVFRPQDQHLVGEFFPAGPALKRPMQMDEFVPPDVPQDPPILIERQPLSLANGAPVPPALMAALSAVDPQFDVCESLAQQETFPLQASFDLELTSSGAPLRVFPVAEGQPTSYVRCLMERVCQFSAKDAAPGAPQRVRIPLRATRDPAPATVR